MTERVALGRRQAAHWKTAHTWFARDRIDAFSPVEWVLRLLGYIPAVFHFQAWKGPGTWVRTRIRYWCKTKEEVGALTRELNHFWDLGMDEWRTNELGRLRELKLTPTQESAETARILKTMHGEKARANKMEQSAKTLLAYAADLEKALSTSGTVVHSEHKEAAGMVAWEMTPTRPEQAQ
jgi:hypothetical protein